MYVLSWSLLGNVFFSDDHIEGLALLVLCLQLTVHGRIALAAPSVMFLASCCHMLQSENANISRIFGSMVFTVAVP